MAFRVDVTLKAYRDVSGILRWLLAEHAGEQGLILREKQTHLFRLGRRS